jgi:hypothetical protein
MIWNYNINFVKIVEVWLNQNFFYQWISVNYFIRFADHVFYKIRVKNVLYA